MTPAKLRESLVVVALVAVEVTRAGRGPGEPHEQQAGQSRTPRFCASRAPAESGRGNARAEGKPQAQAPTDALHPRTARSRSCKGPRGIREAGQPAARRRWWRRLVPGSVQEDLAELFKRDLDKLANQYETAQSAQQQQSDQQVDALMEKLRELARRQQQEAERQRQQALAGQGGQGGGASQRALAEQAEETARQLERLSRERNRPDLAQALRPRGRPPTPCGVRHRRRSKQRRAGQRGARSAARSAAPSRAGAGRPRPTRHAIGAATGRRNRTPAPRAVAGGDVVDAVEHDGPSERQGASGGAGQVRTRSQGERARETDRPHVGRMRATIAKPRANFRKLPTVPAITASKSRSITREA